MSGHALIIEVRLLADRWHGSSGWPPSPFRLFQALVAGAYGGRWQNEDHSSIDAAFRWLECMTPPTVIAPRARSLNSVVYYVPDNDLDAVGNDPRRVAEIRSAKLLKSTLLVSTEPFSYIWAFEGAVENAERIASLSERLHTFGRGMDGAYARGFIVQSDFASAYSEARSALRVLPSHTESGNGGSELECPVPGSFDSLKRRYGAAIERFYPVQGGSRKARASVFRQPPKADLRLVAYGRSPRHLVFDVRESSGNSFYPLRLRLASAITTQIRDIAFDRLSAVIEDLETRERIVLGRGATDADHSSRCRFIALPSIGTRFTDTSIRRIVVELPPDCPLEVGDVRWALAGRPLVFNDSSGEVRAILVPTADRSMLRRYIGRGSRRWQTITPAVLPTVRVEGRIDGGRRSQFERSLAGAVCDALRHAGVAGCPTEIRVQREPLLERGTPAGDFATARFDAACLRHVEIRFAEPVSGPLLIGDGRWLSLGLMRPLRDHDDELAAPADASDSVTDEPDVVESAGDSDSDEEQ